ncbi:flagellar biosynthesis anti-sigma factor FlgM [Acidocella sp. KAb 2-4]|uniref:flagellar biosynthesis anti-sigma factor FlgM n=1 Tax=Acidocella sp. KAb 2-4 TaxID=2885158 RepID=UPI001D06709E|nr:flagellar biosynthesis anti-sigma factor FlgM [Acidocella sp. KAb 2-4]MCB5945703.1 flagellar biosynthesis anti-sigma factor FlgM [Acidocella sp. KAb 2-4]
MSNTIPPLSAATSAAVTTEAAPPPATAKSTSSAETTPQTEAVTLSDAAQTSTQLLSAAQQSAGIDHEAVARIRNALAAGNYNVAPEDLAQAMVAVLKVTSK